MRTLKIFALVSMLTLSTQVLADMNENKQCDTIAKACLSAGYTKNDGQGKQFWQDCMRSILLNKSVSSVNVEKQDVSACRAYKIEKMKDEMNQLQAASEQK